MTSDELERTEIGRFTIVTKVAYETTISGWNSPEGVIHNLGLHKWHFETEDEARRGHEVAVQMCRRIDEMSSGT